MTKQLPEYISDLLFQIWCLDCIEGMRFLPDGCVGQVTTSIPFGALFTYSGKRSDIGNCIDGIDMRANEFGLHMRFFIAELLRVMMPGRNVCIHIQQLLTTKVQHGVMGRRDFRGAVVDLFTSGGFEWKGEVAIPKDPQAIAQRQQLHSLQFKTGIDRDACQLAPAVNDFIMIFQKAGVNPEPVRSLFDGKNVGRNAAGWVSTEQWIEWAHGTWNIDEMDILEGWMNGREEEDEKHVCPMQLKPIFNLISLYSNPGDLVMDPFTGIGSTAWVALGGRTKAGHRLAQPRRFVGFELKESYCELAIRNAQRAIDNPMARKNTDQMSLEALAA